MKRFMYFSVSVLCLAVAVLIGFHVGSYKVEAQSQPQVSGYVASGNYGTWQYVMLPNGDVYTRTIATSPYPYHFVGTPAYYVGNFWEGTVAADQSTWGHIKNIQKQK